MVETLDEQWNLPNSHMLAAEIAGELELALEQMQKILVDLEERVSMNVFSVGIKISIKGNHLATEVRTTMIIALYEVNDDTSR